MSLGGGDALLERLVLSGSSDWQRLALLGLEHRLFRTGYKIVVHQRLCLASALVRCHTNFECRGLAVQQLILLLHVLLDILS